MSHAAVMVKWESPEDLQVFIEGLTALKSNWQKKVEAGEAISPFVWVKGFDI